jgi:DNA gyrase/topoisomerase IV subunit A
MVDARMAIVEALVLLGEPGNARRLVDITQASADQAELYRAIADEWALTEIQAVALADTQVRKLTQESRLQLLEELEKLKAKREDLCAELGQ